MSLYTCASLPSCEILSLLSAFLPGPNLSSRLKYPVTLETPCILVLPQWGQVILLVSKSAPQSLQYFNLKLIPKYDTSVWSLVYAIIFSTNSPVGLSSNSTYDILPAVP